MLSHLSDENLTNNSFVKQKNPKQETIDQQQSRMVNTVKD